MASIPARDKEFFSRHINSKGSERPWGCRKVAADIFLNTKKNNESVELQKNRPFPNHIWSCYSFCTWKIILL